HEAIRVHGSGSGRERRDLGRGEAAVVEEEFVERALESRVGAVLRVPEPVLIGGNIPHMDGHCEVGSDDRAIDVHNRGASTHGNGNMLPSIELESDATLNCLIWAIVLYGQLGFPRSAFGCNEGEVLIGAGSEIE